MLIMAGKANKTVIVYLNPVGDQVKGGRDVIAEVLDCGWSEGYETFYVAKEGEVYTYPYASVRKVSEKIETSAGLRVV